MRLSETGLQEFKQRYWPDNKGTLRLGQAFVNFFDLGPWPELFYCEDEGRVNGMIFRYLEDLHYSWYNRL